MPKRDITAVLDATNRPRPVFSERLGFGIALLGVTTLMIALNGYKLGQRPWDHDEVASLVEVGVLSVDVPGAPTAQLQRMRSLVPVWYAAQHAALSVLPRNELGTRILPAVCGTLIVVLSFVLAWRHRGPSFAIALAILVGLSEPIIWLSQYNRFYTLALLALTGTIGLYFWRTERQALAIGLCAFGAVIAVLCHNLLVVVYGVYFVAALIGVALRVVPVALLGRTGAAAGATAATYLIYLKPLLVRWMSGNTGGTSELVSLTVAAGIPTIALALLGITSSLSTRLRDPEAVWWTLTLVGGLIFVGLGSCILGNWNPRYAILFMPPVWVMAARGVTWLVRLPRTTWGAIAIYSFVAVLLLPKLASYLRDGSRHDLRASARVVAAQSRGGETVYCNWPLELDYYLKGAKENRVVGWWRSDTLPDAGCLIVYASNVFEPVLSFPDRRCDVLAEIGTRRFDEQSYWVRVYRVDPRILVGCK